MLDSFSSSCEMDQLGRFQGSLCCVLKKKSALSLSLFFKQNKVRHNILALVHHRGQQRTLYVRFLDSLIINPSGEVSPMTNSCIYKKKNFESHYIPFYLLLFSILVVPVSPHIHNEGRRTCGKGLNIVNLCHRRSAQTVWAITFSSMGTITTTIPISSCFLKCVNISSSYFSLFHVNWYVK